jgi:GNAT superfamily N-acetyltransferase
MAARWKAWPMSEHAAAASNLRVRDARIEDLDSIVDFNLRLARESESREPDAALLRRGVQSMFGETSRGRYFMAESAGRIVGQTMITYEWSDWRCGMFWWIQSVYVVPEARGSGVFRTLFKHIRELAQREGGICGLRLYVEHENQPAIATYTRLGMKPTGHLMYEEDWSASVRPV